MAVTISAFCAALAVLLLTSPGAAPARRLRGPGRRSDASSPIRRRRPPGSTGEPPPRRRSRLAVAAGVAVALAVGNPPGAVAGVVAAFGAWWWLGRRYELAASSDRRRLDAGVPLTADLLAACMAAGGHPAAAAEAVAAAIGGPIGDELRRVTATLRLGGDPASTWRSLGARSALAPIGRAFARSASTGAALADTLTDIAEDMRRRHHTAAEAAARRVGVHAAAPLGLCFLPAFVLLAVVPIIAGLLQDIPLR